MASLSRREFLTTAAALTGLAATGGLSGCSGQSPGGALDLEFFQFKSEAIGLFDEICAQFNAANPGLRVRQNFVADNVTALRVRLVKEDTPDLVSINGDYNFGALARSKVFYDFSQLEVMQQVQEGVAQILPTLGTGEEGQQNALPFANNGSGVIYNRAIFDEHGVEPPTTWDEFIEVCDVLADAGVDPFLWGFRDNWTGAPMLSSISGGFLTEGVAEWYAKRRDGAVSFGDLVPVFDKMTKLATYGNSNKFEIGYNDGNQGFAQGLSAMYVHGTYAIPAIRSYNPDIEVGTFAMPADDAADTRVVSGVDVALTMGAQPQHEEECLQFVEHLMAEENMLAYCAEQVAFPTLRGTLATDPALEGLAPYFAEDKLATYSDHNFAAAINLNNHMQQFLISGDTDRFVETLDSQWDKVNERLQAAQQGGS